MKLRLALFVGTLLLAAPANAERLKFDHRLSPPLKAVFDGGDPAMIDFNDKNPRYVTDLIAIQGKSAKDWIEALLIVARTPDKKVRTVAEWVAELQAEGQRRCASQFRTLAEDPASTTFERRSSGCASGYPPVALYRVVAGKNSLFLLGFLHKAEPSPQEEEQWRAVLASATID
ncbi:MAG: hypothetical protein EBR34_05630 [Sphingomonadaceae bacterium]|nr:hypothetical protein [Sphingomonadaceae bacterium]